MASRIILVGTNRNFPRLVVCRNCGGTGHDWATTNNPSEKPFRVPCPTCNAEGAYEKAVA